MVRLRMRFGTLAIVLFVVLLLVLYAESKSSRGSSRGSHSHGHRTESHRRDDKHTTHRQKHRSSWGEEKRHAGHSRVKYGKHRSSSRGLNRLNAPSLLNTNETFVDNLGKPKNTSHPHGLNSTKTNLNPGVNRGRHKKSLREFDSVNAPSLLNTSNTTEILLERLLRNYTNQVYNDGKPGNTSHPHGLNFTKTNFNPSQLHPSNSTESYLLQLAKNISHQIINGGKLKNSSHPYGWNSTKNNSSPGVKYGRPMNSSRGWDAVYVPSQLEPSYTTESYFLKIAKNISYQIINGGKLKNSSHPYSWNFTKNNSSPSITYGRPKNSSRRLDEVYVPSQVDPSNVTESYFMQLTRNISQRLYNVGKSQNTSQRQGWNSTNNNSGPAVKYGRPKNSSFRSDAVYVPSQVDPSNVTESYFMQLTRNISQRLYNVEKSQNTSQLQGWNSTNNNSGPAVKYGRPKNSSFRSDAVYVPSKLDPSNVTESYFMQLTRNISQRLYNVGKSQNTSQHQDWNSSKNNSGPAVKYGRPKNSSFSLDAVYVPSKLDPSNVTESYFMQLTRNISQRLYNVGKSQNTSQHQGWNSSKNNSGPAVKYGRPKNSSFSLDAVYVPNKLDPSNVTESYFMQLTRNISQRLYNVGKSQNTSQHQGWNSTKNDSSPYGNNDHLRHRRQLSKEGYVLAKITNDFLANERDCNETLDARRKRDTETDTTKKNIVINKVERVTKFVRITGVGNDKFYIPLSDDLSKKQSKEKSKDYDHKINENAKKLEGESGHRTMDDFKVISHIKGKEGVSVDAVEDNSKKIRRLEAYNHRFLRKRSLGTQTQERGTLSTDKKSIGASKETLSTSDVEVLPSTVTVGKIKPRFSMNYLTANSPRIETNTVDSHGKRTSGINILRVHDKAKFYKKITIRPSTEGVTASGVVIDAPPKTIWCPKGYRNVRGRCRQAWVKN